ncbi:MAG: prepilin-type N-terminal cleavage/methylation domain-containing protein [Verrucomicrobiales bacterium]|nr:prepilin-type N-terminal cleavage/methylation domain-containing protein [Verrucomicrobiales bacterium]
MTPPKPRRIRGATLIEMMIYIGLLAVVLGIGVNGLIRVWGAHGTLRRQADAIVLAADTGERWRADIRSATGAIRSETAPGGQLVTIPVGNRVVTWGFSNGLVWRQSAADNKATPLLSGVRSSRMEPEPREGVRAWIWDLELERIPQKARTAPIYTFLAVEGGGS